MSTTKAGESYTAAGVTYVKHNVRAKRDANACRNGCGQEVWWSHAVDSSAKQSNLCREHGYSNWTLVGKNGQPHADQCPKRKVTPGTVFGTPEIKPEPELADWERELLDMPEVTELPKPEFKPVSVPTSDAGEAARIQELMSILMRPSITPEQVADMVKGAVEDNNAVLLDTVQEFLNTWRANQHEATHVKIEYADGATVKIENVHPKFDKILRLVMLGSNVLLVGPMGSGKSTIARNLATALQRKSLIFTCSVGTTKSDILGYMAADGYHPSPFATAWERGYVICMDELDTLHPQVSPIVNDAFAAKELQFPNGKTDDDGDLVPIPLGPGGVIIAAANTVGRGADKMYVGRSKIDAATLDRFALVEIDYDMALEDMLVARTGASAKVQANALKVCRDLRKAAARKNVAANYGVRAMVDICRMVQAGFSHDEIVWGRLNRGIGDSDWLTLTREVEIPLLAA